MPVKHIKKYVKSAKERPDYAFFDMLNVILVVFILSMFFLFILWIVSAFKGDVSINPVAFSIGKFNTYWYGITFALAFLLGLWVIVPEAKRQKINSDLLINYVFGTIITGFIGARLTFVFLTWEYYSQNPIQILNIWQGGLSLYGAILGGFLFVLIYSLIKKANYLKILDIFSPAMLLGQVIGRWGNFFNQELFGYPARSILKMYISPIKRPIEYRASAYFHPVFLYESFLCLIALIVLLLIRRKKWIKDGEVFIFYVVFYSAIRFFIEFIRIEPRIYMGLTLAQIVSLALFTTFVIILFALRKLRKKTKKRRK